jgi:hypothetical protein
MCGFFYNKGKRVMVKLKSGLLGLPYSAKRHS